jgi:hypothetical protein
MLLLLGVFGTSDEGEISGFKGVKIQVVVFWVVTPCSDMVGYQCFGGLCYLHLQSRCS